MSAAPEKKQPEKSSAASLLKLRAADAEDVQVISAVLQDSITPVCDMAYLADEKRFVMVAQRLRRETGKDGACGERICSALTVMGVTAIKTQGIDAAQSERMLDLLAIMLEGNGSDNRPEGDGPQSKSMTLVFAGGARLRLDLGGKGGNWTAALEDFGDTWPAQCAPCHE
jgi:hypothetical protein